MCISHASMVRNLCDLMPFWWKWPFDPCDPTWPQMNFNVITFCEGVKLMHMHRSRVNTAYSAGLDAFWVKITFLTPVTPSWPHRDLWPHHRFCMSSGQGTGHFDQLWSKSNVGKYVKNTCCQKKEERRKGKGEETTRVQKPAGPPAG